MIYGLEEISEMYCSIHTSFKWENTYTIIPVQVTFQENAKSWLHKTGGPNIQVIFSKNINSAILVLIFKDRFIAEDELLRQVWLVLTVYNFSAEMPSGSGF